MLTRQARFGEMRRLQRTRDLSLPDWGPYAKSHFALCHIADPQRGTLFECLTIPGTVGRQKYFPDKRDASNWTPVDANDDLSFYAMRCSMEDGLHADLRFFERGRNARLCEAVFRNERRTPVNCQLDCAMGFQHEGERVKLTLRRGESFLGAHRFVRLSVDLAATEKDQLREGSVASAAFIERQGFGPAFTSLRGAAADYLWQLPGGRERTAVSLRYALSGRRNAVIRFTMKGRSASVTLFPTGEGLSFVTLRLREVCRGPATAGEYPLRLEITEPPADGQLHIDGFLLTRNGTDLAAEGRLRRVPAQPALRRHVFEDMVAIESPLVPGRFYGVMRARGPKFHAWMLKAGDMLAPVRRLGVTSRFWARDRRFDDGNEHVFADLRPLFCEPGRTLRIRLAVGFAASLAALRRTLHAALRDGAPQEGATFKAERKYEPCLKTVVAATMTSVCYPQDFGDEYVRYFTPGAYYPTLYQWDAGMQGIGLLEHAPRLALEGLNAYLARKGDVKPLILHGTALPTQTFLYWELFQRSGDRRMLAALYPGMRRYYRFMAGKDGSRMDPFGSGLLSPWAYFYNAGGWDDYPAQAHVTHNGLGRTMSPVVNTAHTIRAARLMALAASELGRPADVEAYEADARRMHDALLAHSWDVTSGYFSYVTDAGKRRLEFSPGVNYNMGLDGVSPLVAGLDSAEVRTRLVAHCRDPRRLWTRYGLSTVDRSAPYFEYGGYWNGAVWVAHQWFMFKAMLDAGEGRFAARLAQATLDAWRQAVAESGGQSFEAIDIRTGRGFGAPYFSALSSPVVALYCACRAPGRITAGFDTMVRDAQFDARRRRLSADIAAPLRPGVGSLLAVMGSPGAYRCRFGNESHTLRTDAAGRLVMTLRMPSEFRRLQIARA